MFESLGNELIEGELVVIQLEGVFEESEDVFVYVYGEIGCEFIHFCINVAECGSGGVDGSETGLFWEIDVVHSIVIQL